MSISDKTATWAIWVIGISVFISFGSTFVNIGMMIARASGCR